MFEMQKVHQHFSHFQTWTIVLRTKLEIRTCMLQFALANQSNNLQIAEKELVGCAR